MQDDERRRQVGCGWRDGQCWVDSRDYRQLGGIGDVLAGRVLRDVEKKQFRDDG